MNRSTTWFARSANRVAALIFAFTIPISTAADGALHQAKAVSPSGFDWLASASSLSQEEAIAQLRARQRAASLTMGVGSWVCSPAGFGRTSYCTRN